MESQTMAIADMQEAIYKAGYQWEEHVFLTDSLYQDTTDVVIKFSKSKSPHAFDLHHAEYDHEITGWGRFPRHIAWSMAYERLINDNDVYHNYYPELAAITVE